MKRALAGLGMCGVLSFVGACGKSDGGPVERSDLAARVAKLQCDSLGACCQRQGHVFDAERCKARLSFELEDEFSENGPNTGYDAEAAAECLSGLHVTCGKIEDGDSASCDRIFPGKLAPGTACTDSDDCRAPEGGSAYCDGVCIVAVPTPHGKLGEACAYTCQGDDCSGAPGQVGAAAPVACYRSEGLYCAFRTAYSCEPLVAVGQPCADGLACVEGAFCSLEGLCTAPRANGAVCASSSECQSGACDGTCGAPRVTDSDCSFE